MKKALLAILVSFIWLIGCGTENINYNSTNLNNENEIDKESISALEVISKTQNFYPINEVQQLTDSLAVDKEAVIIPDLQFAQLDISVSWELTYIGYCNMFGPYGWYYETFEWICNNTENSIYELYEPFVDLDNNHSIKKHYINVPSSAPELNYGEIEPGWCRGMHVTYMSETSMDNHIWVKNYVFDNQGENVDIARRLIFTNPINPSPITIERTMQLASKNPQTLNSIQATTVNAQSNIARRIFIHELLPINLINISWTAGVLGQQYIEGQGWVWRYNLDEYITNNYATPITYLFNTTTNLNADLRIYQNNYEYKNVTLQSKAPMIMLGQGFSKDSLVDQIWIKHYAFERNGEIISKAQRIIF